MTGCGTGLAASSAGSASTTTASLRWSAPLAQVAKCRRWNVAAADMLPRAQDETVLKVAILSHIDAKGGWCQSNANQSPTHPKSRRSGRKLTPLSQGGRAALLEDISAVEVAVLIEVVVYRGVNGSKFLQGLDVPEFRHRALSSSKGLV